MTNIIFYAILKAESALGTEVIKVFISNNYKITEVFMKHIARLLLIVIILSLCLQLVSCGIIEYVSVPRWRKGNTKFMVTIDSISGFKTLDFEISQTYYLHVKLYNEDATDDTYKDIKIDYNHENVVVSYAYKTKNVVTFKIYCYELGSDDKLSVTYNGKAIKVNYNVLDYDFEKHGYVTPDSLAALDKYPEFRDMLYSIKRHEYMEPYIGIEIKSYNNSKKKDYVYWSCNLRDNNQDPGYADTDYLKYLKDSVYYPARFNLVYQNPVASRDCTMRIPRSADTSAGSSRVTMEYFGLGYHVIDPDCTNPQYPLTSMSYSARPKNDAKIYEENDVEPIYPSAKAILLERYPERFLKYQLDDITVYILYSNENGADAYFEDDVYFYSIYANY